MTKAASSPTDPNPVDDVRRIRERLDREAGGNIHKLAEQSKAAVEQYRHSLNLKMVATPKRDARQDGKAA